MSIAALRLTIPKQNLHISRDTTRVYRDVLVNQVLNTQDFEGQFDKLLSNLHSLNRIPVNGDTRLSLSETIIHHYLLFIRQVRSGERTLTDSQKQELPNLNREFAFAAKLILRDTVPHSKEETANFVYWAISAMAEQLQDYSEQYRPQPPVLWGELNRLYQYAEAYFLTDFHANKPDNRDIESRYKQALLFEAAQPEHLNHPERQLVDAYLRQWAFRAHLNHQESREFNGHYFYIDLDHTRGVMTARQVQGAGNDESIRTLNPLPLIEQARQHMNQLRNGGDPAKIGFPEGTDPIDAFMALKKGLSAWKQSSSRRFERAACADQAQCAIGLHKIHQYLRTPKLSKDALVGSQTVNMSKTGACVRFENWRDAPDPAVGDIVMHCQEGQSIGKLGTVRWLKRDNATLLCGLEFIVGNLQPVTVRVQDRISEALLVSTSDNDSLITHKGYCASNAAVRLKSTRHGLALDARAQSLVQRGHHTDQIRLKRSQSA